MRDALIMTSGLVGGLHCGFVTFTIQVADAYGNVPYLFFWRDFLLSFWNIVP